jgi:GDPmannose 4,6-dehydratase
MQRSVILGSSGQDGTILYNKLEILGYDIIGLTQNKSKSTITDYDGLDLNITNEQAIFKLIKDFQPTEVYHLSAYQHSSSEIIEEKECDIFNNSFEINTKSLQIILEALSLFSRDTSLFYAASSSIFANTDTDIQTEETPYSPIDYYGISKVAGIYLCEYYRKKAGLNIAVGIMYNHESIYRKKKFVSYKIIHHALEIANKKRDELILGNLQSKVDWGSANDYVDAMYLLTRNNISDNFIIASGVLHSVEDFVSIVFNYLGLNYKEYVIVNPNLIKKSNRNLCGDISKIKQTMNWEPKIKFEEMIIEMIEHYKKGMEIG